MRRTLPILLALLGAGALAAPASAREPYERLLKEKADLVVSVKFTLQLTINARGETHEQEAPSSAIGILVDKSGLVMISNGSLSPSIPRSRGMEVKVTPSQFRVVFPGDTKEHAAILGATESKIGLAFIRIRDLEGKAIAALAGEEAASAEPAAGDVLYGVSRLPEGFDFAPYVDELRVSGRLSKPRELINVEGSFLSLADPVFDATGAVVGVVVSQQGVGDGGSGIFVLPWKTASGTIQRALKASETALEEAKKREAEGAEKPSEEKPAEKPSGEPSKDEPADEKPAEKPSDEGGER